MNGCTTNCSSWGPARVRRGDGQPPLHRCCLLKHCLLTTGTCGKKWPGAYRPPMPYSPRTAATCLAPALCSPLQAALGGAIDAAQVVEFVDAGRDVLLAVDSEVSEELRSLAQDLGVDVDAR